jgi:polysaccharide export outer membrane protein
LISELEYSSPRIVGPATCRTKGSEVLWQGVPESNKYERSREMKPKFLLIAPLLCLTLTCAGQDQKPSEPTPPAAASPALSPAPAPQNLPPPGVTPAPLAAGKLAESYVIGATDVLTINVWKEAAFTGSYSVRPDGMITMPLVGDLLAAGFTPTNLAGQITEKLRKYLQDPEVTVTVTAIHSKVVFMMGQTLKKGPMDMIPGMTVLQALSIAGLSDDANVKKTYLLRDENGARTKIPIHYKEAMKGELQYDIPLKPGDTIVVP